jgi:exosortase A-associated hydrolase 2
VVAVHIEPRWIGDGDQRRFGLYVSPDGPVRSALLFVPPFGEEMNKSRRLVAVTARALAWRGHAVLIFDPFGCGDSPGHFEQADWNLWCADVCRAHAWLESAAGTQVSLWALRAGALLALAAMARLPRLPRLLLWQPVASGKAHVTQFLRLKVAADTIAGVQPATTTAALWSALSRGEVLDIAGYRLPPAVAVPMGAATLDAPPAAQRIDWIDVGTPGEPAPASLKLVQSWRALGTEVRHETVVGPPFWQTQELEHCPALVDATLERIEARHE